MPSLTPAGLKGAYLFTSHLTGFFLDGFLAGAQNDAKFRAVFKVQPSPFSTLLLGGHD
jgi:hypothetical protein